MKYESYTDYKSNTSILEVKAEVATTSDLKFKRLVFKEGQRVALRSQPEFLMTIDQFITVNEYALKIECVWLDAGKKLCREIFNATSLVIVDEDVIESKQDV